MAGLTDYIPELGVDVGGIAGQLALLVIAILITVVLSVFLFLFLQNRSYNKKIVVFEKVNGKFEPAKKDRAKVIPLGAGGDSVFYLKKGKKYLPTPELQTGRNTYWYFVREDQEWINFSPGDFDSQSKSMGALMLDKEMRYARTSLQAKIKERYDKPGFWAQYGGMVINVAAITIIMVFLFLIVLKMIELQGSVNGAISAVKPVLDQAERILGAVDNIGGGSGLAPS